MTAGSSRENRLLRIGFSNIAFLCSIHFVFFFFTRPFLSRVFQIDNLVTLSCKSVDKATKPIRNTSIRCRFRVRDYILVLCRLLAVNQLPLWTWKQLTFRAFTIKPGQPTHWFVYHYNHHVYFHNLMQIERVSSGGRWGGWTYNLKSCISTGFVLFLLNFP